MSAVRGESTGRGRSLSCPLSGPSPRGLGAGATATARRSIVKTTLPSRVRSSPPRAPWPSPPMGGDIVITAPETRVAGAARPRSQQSPGSTVTCSNATRCLAAAGSPGWVRTWLASQDANNKRVNSPALGAIGEISTFGPPPSHGRRARSSTRNVNVTVHTNLCGLASSPARPGIRVCPGRRCVLQRAAVFAGTLDSVIRAVLVPLRSPPKRQGRAETLLGAGRASRLPVEQ